MLFETNFKSCIDYKLDGDEARRVREDAELSVKETSEILDCSESIIYKIEAGTEHISENMKRDYFYEFNRANILNEKYKGTYIVITLEEYDDMLYQIRYLEEENKKLVLDNYNKSKKIKELKKEIRENVTI